VLAAELTAVRIGAPERVLFGLGVLCFVAFFIEAFAFLFLLFKDRDALRSERFTIAKLQVQQGLLGDSLTGFRRIETGSGSRPEASDKDSTR
jgi:hypothetical protein